MERQPPVAPSDEIDLYVRTYTSLLRSSGEIRVRAFEEAHTFSGAALHSGAASLTPDLAAFGYAAGRLPVNVADMRLVLLGQSHETFEAKGHDVQRWTSVRTRGRRRPLRYDDASRSLAVFISSVSDIDDLIPIVTAYQIEWNKMHARLRGVSDVPTDADIATLLAIDAPDVDKLREAFGPDHFEARIRQMAAAPLDIRVQLLEPSYSQYQRAAQRWWSGVEPTYLRPKPPRRAPVYFVSSNTHAIANLVGGYARAELDGIRAYAKRKNPEGLADDLERAMAASDETEVASIAYYMLRAYLHEGGRERIEEARKFESHGGLTHLSEPGHLEIDAQLVEIGKLVGDRLDPRLRIPGVDLLARSEAVILNIDYPLGMAAYHLLSRVGQGVGEVRGIYVMGKAATLNARVGDVSLSSVVYDEHSRNTFLFRNAFGARDVSPFLRYGSVFDNQAALTVRSAFLQNERYMGTFYRDGYTVLEMEAGPFLSAIYELVNPTRVPTNEIVHLSQTPFDVGMLHYASDTPYSRRQSLLSKSLSYFGVDSTYACATTIVKRILEQEIARIVSPRQSVLPPAPK